MLPTKSFCEGFLGPKHIHVMTKADLAALIRLTFALALLNFDRSALDVATVQGIDSLSGSFFRIHMHESAI